MERIEKIERGIDHLREQLTVHRMYEKLTTLEDVRLFMGEHIFPVWDFMSLLKALQMHLTTVTVPWVPKPSGVLARFINEIVHGEESDINEVGEPKSHFEMYIDAMDEVGADTTQIKAFIDLINAGHSVSDATDGVKMSKAAREFLNFTFEVIATGKPHAIASAFTFGREDIIPDMFLEIVKNAEKEDTKKSYNKLIYYLNRHIEIDGGEHGPLSLKLISELCGDDDEKWDETLSVAIQSLEYRVALWDAVADIIEAKRKTVAA